MQVASIGEHRKAHGHTVAQGQKELPLKSKSEGLTNGVGTCC